MTTQSPSPANPAIQTVSSTLGANLSCLKTISTPGFPCSRILIARQSRFGKLPSKKNFTPPATDAHSSRRYAQPEAVCRTIRPLGPPTLRLQPLRPPLASEHRIRQEEAYRRIDEDPRQPRLNRC